MDYAAVTLLGSTSPQIELLIEQRALHTFERVWTGRVHPSHMVTVIRVNDNPILDPLTDSQCFVVVVEAVDAFIKLNELLRTVSATNVTLKWQLHEQVSSRHLATNSSLRLLTTSSSNQSTSNLLPSNNQPKPFCLSNAAFEQRTPKPITLHQTRKISPIIERAMQEAIERDERRQRISQGVESYQDDDDNVKHERQGRKVFKITDQDLEEVKVEDEKLLLQGILKVDKCQDDQIVKVEASDNENVDFEPVNEENFSDYKSAEPVDERTHADTFEPVDMTDSSVVAVVDPAEPSETTETSSEVAEEARSPVLASSDNNDKVSLHETETIFEPAARSTSVVNKITRPSQSAPRPTKASLLRLGVGNLSNAKSTATVNKNRIALSTTERAKVDIERRTSNVTTSTQGILTAASGPRITPRPTKASALRTEIVGMSSPVMTRTLSAPTPTETVSRRASAAPVMERAKSQDLTTKVLASPNGTLSTMRPKIEPRMSRASLLRLGVVVTSPSISHKPHSKTDNGDSFAGIAGPPRRQSVAVVPTKAPLIAPRLNKSALLRQNSGESLLKPVVTKTLNARSMNTTLHAPASRSASVSSCTSQGTSTTLDSTSAVKSFKRSTIGPRLNKSAELRQVKSQAGRLTASAIESGKASESGKTSAFAERSNQA
ncbi:hypothetical protein OIO90_000165 [Microbotryomycetes sp. JL221]|nr:hypothetical protein OIO90_000165 [Microbotryomycetes sp. JL221]